MQGHTFTEWRYIGMGDSKCECLTCGFEWVDLRPEADVPPCPTAQNPASAVRCEDEDPDLMDLAQCSGCGEYRSVRALGTAHACHRAEDGSYEEGGTFQ